MAGRIAGPGLEMAWPEEVPWSVLGPEFQAAWRGDSKGGKLSGQHLEVTGQSGSGKSYALATIMQERARRYGTAEVILRTKRDDDSLPLLAWPEVDTYEDLRRYRWAVYFPETRKLGAEAEKYHEQKIYDLLSRLFTPGANCVLAFDEIGYVEDLSWRLKKLIRQMWREARSHGISIIAMKQRPIGVVRDQHSETRWKIVFPPADQGDMQRFAELLGRPADWAPVLEGLDQERHQFVIRNTFTRESYISWIDDELRPVAAQQHQEPQGTSQVVYGRRSRALSSS